MEPKQNHVERVVHCNNCGCNIFEHGITEVIYGGTGETDITFNGKTPNTIFGPTDISNFTDQVTYCLNCGQILWDGNIPASEIINFYEGETEYFEGYINFHSGAPTPNVID